MLRSILVVLVLLFTAILSLLPVLSYAQTATTPSSSSSTAESFWTQGAPMPTPRTEVTASILEANIYVIGGYII
jgi:hypothetical protein